MARILRAPLLVAADGRNSATREAAGIPIARWKYDHQAIVSVLGHERPHDHVAYEIFYPSGPFALLPMNDDRRAGIARRSCGRSRTAMRPGGCRSTTRISPPRRKPRWAVFSARSRCWRRARPSRSASTMPRGSPTQRLALVGDAAHAIHPIAGQGLNLGFRDVAALAQVLVEGARLGLDLGDAQLLDRYQRWRSLDALSVAFATDSPDPPLRRSRQDRVGGPPLRHGPGRPHLAAAQPLDERSARHQRRASAAAAGPADLITGASARSRRRRSPPCGGTASAGPADRRGRSASLPRAAPAWRRRRTARPGRWR